MVEVDEAAGSKGGLWLSADCRLSFLTKSVLVTTIDVADELVVDESLMW